jgi:hypothetical protein
MSAPRRVYQFSLNGDFVAEYESSREAFRLTGIRDRDIRSNCQGKKASAGRHLWSYTKTPPKYDPYRKKKKPVLQFDLNMNLIKRWESMEAASTTLKINNLSRAIYGYKNIKTCGGYIWRFAEK